MKNTTFILTLFLTCSIGLFGQAVHPPDNSISLKFVVDGHPLSCKDVKVELSIGQLHMLPTPTADGFIVPTEFTQAYASESLRHQGNVGATISCGENTVSFSGLYPSWVLAGSWEAGISYPTSWFDSMNHSTAPEEGAWASYLVAECNDCDPGVVVTVTHPDVPPDLVDQLRKEQSSDVGERARNVAFALAIFKSDYETNRDFLLKLLRVCLSRPRNSAEDDVCDTKLVDEIANLYWRGDAELLQPLLNAADRRDDVLGEAGGFYSDLLDRRTALVVGELRKLPEEKQRMVCEMAATDDLRFDSPKLDRVMKNLRATGDDVAERCILVLNKTTSHKP